MTQIAPAGTLALPQAFQPRMHAPVTGSLACMMRRYTTLRHGAQACALFKRARSVAASVLSASMP